MVVKNHGLLPILIALPSKRRRKSVFQKQFFFFFSIFIHLDLEIEILFGYLTSKTCHF